jgi:hypothetical protein
VRGAGTGLIHVDDEVIREPSLERFVCRPDDGVGDIGGQPAERCVGFRGRLLDQNRGANELFRRGQAADAKVVDRPLRLRAVVRVSRNVNVAERIAFDAVFNISADSGQLPATSSSDAQ